MYPVRKYKVKCVISYDGTHFHGYQKQVNKRTVQSELEKTLAQIYPQEKAKLFCSGRTDAGVHAKGQVVHYETDIQIPKERLLTVFNHQLAKDIYVQSLDYVDLDFHARYSATEKHYKYRIMNTDKRDVFDQDYAYYYPYPLDLAAMQAACPYFVGRHDFTTFSSARSTAKGSKERYLSEVSLTKDEEAYILTLKGNGFLYHMARIIAGVILDCGRGRLAPDEIPHLFEAKNRQAVGRTLPACGLYLWDVKYEER